MIVFNFILWKQFKQLLNDVEGVQKDDIYFYAGGYLNEFYLYKFFLLWGSSKWIVGKGKRIFFVDKSIVLNFFVRKLINIKDIKMKDILYDFSVGITGSVLLYNSEINMGS